MRKHNGFIDPISLISLGFLVLGLIVTTAIVKNPNLKLDLRSSAAVCPDPCSRDSDCGADERCHIPSTGCAYCEVKPAALPKSSTSPSPSASAKPSCGTNGDFCCGNNPGTCNPGLYCSPIDDGTCMPNICHAERKCEENVLKICKSDNSGWNNTTCQYGCNPTTLNCNPCSVGQYRCSGQNLEVCPSNGQGFMVQQVCPFNTSCNVQLQSCTSNTGSCIDPCSNDDECGDGFYCDRPSTGCPVCKTIEKFCEPDDVICSSDNKYVQRCNLSGSRWIQQLCQFGCNQTTKECNPKPAVTTCATLNQSCATRSCCSNSNLFCNGSRTCQLLAASATCADLNQSCATKSCCTADMFCSSSRKCERKLLSIGAPCTENGQCQSGYCMNEKQFAAAHTGAPPAWDATTTCITAEVSQGLDQLATGIAVTSGAVGVTTGLGALSAIVPTTFTIANLVDDTATGIACAKGDQNACAYFIPALANPIPGMSLVSQYADDLASLFKPVNNIINELAWMKNLPDANNPAGWTLGNYGGQTVLPSIPDKIQQAKQLIINNPNDSLIAKNALNPLIDEYIKLGKTPYEAITEVTSQLVPTYPTTLAQQALLSQADQAKTLGELLACPFSVCRYNTQATNVVAKNYGYNPLTTVMNLQGSSGNFGHMLTTMVDPNVSGSLVFLDSTNNLVIQSTDKMINMFGSQGLTQSADLVVKTLDPNSVSGWSYSSANLLP